MITYKKRRKYKYSLAEDYSHQTDVKVTKDADLFLVKIDTTGFLQIKKGYAWDGPSGPTFDTKNFMSGSLVHDALYQLMREGKIGRDQRLRADEILREICIEDGMSKIRAWWAYVGVKWFGASSAKPDLLNAP